jgi:hypothetical protein
MTPTGLIAIAVVGMFGGSLVELKGMDFRILGCFMLFLISLLWAANNENVKY